MFFVFFVLGGRGKDLSTPSRIKDADPRGHGRRHAYYSMLARRTKTSPQPLQNLLFLTEFKPPRKNFFFKKKKYQMNIKYFSPCRDSRPVERNSANNPFQLIEREKVETKCKPCHWTTAMSLYK